MTWSRVWAAAASACLAGLAGLAIAMAVASDSGLGRIFFAAFGLLFLAATLRQLLVLWSPLPMFTATREGITTFLNGHHYSRQGFTVPWSAVASMERATRHEQPGNRRLETVTVRVRPPMRIAREVSYCGAEDDDQLLHLDASTGSLRGKALLDALLESWHRFDPKSSRGNSSSRSRGASPASVSNPRHTRT